MSDRCIRITARIALIVSIVVMAMSLVAIGCGILLSGGIKEMLHGSIDNVHPDDPGGGWLALGGIFGSFIGGFAAALLVAMGITGVIVVFVLGTPILVGWIIWKKTGNRKAYTICCIIPVALISLCMIVSYIISFLGNFSMLLM